MKRKVKIEKLKSNPENPRLIKDVKFNKLVSSLREFPEMLEIRPIIIDEDNVVLGGNMRLKAAIELGLKEVWIDTAWGLNEEQKKEFVIKDNSSFGEWDWDILANLRSKLDSFYQESNLELSRLIDQKVPSLYLV